MNGLVIILIGIVALGAGYLFYGRWLAKKWGIDPNAKTPAYTHEDGEDYVPSSRFTVFSCLLYTSAPEFRTVPTPRTSAQTSCRTSPQPHPRPDVYKRQGLNLATRHNIPYVEEGNFVLLCEKMSATRITEDSFLLPEIKEKWYKDGDMHTMYVAEIIDILAR